MNLRGYPGKAAIPTCLDGLKDDTPTPCFAQPHGHVALNGIKATLYTVNQDADQWHLLLRVAPQGVAVHGVRAPRTPAQLPQARGLPQAGARLARPDPAVELDVRLTRRQMLAGAAAGVVGATGVYELVDHLAGSSPKRPVAVDRLPEQHLLEGVRIVEQENVEVLVPPLHHEVVTGRLTVTPADLGDARMALESLLAGLEADYAPTPAGLGVTVAWGLPYFEQFVPAAARRHLPHDRRANRPALTPSRRFPSDPAETVLEANDLAILLRSDVRAHIDDALARLQRGGLFDVTSLRRGFAGGGFDGGRSLPKQMAMAAGVPGADLIPLGSELFLGFTSTQRAAFGPGKIANFETLGFVDLRAAATSARGRTCTSRT